MVVAKTVLRAMERGEANHLYLKSRRVKVRPWLKRKQGPSESLLKLIEIRNKVTRMIFLLRRKEGILTLMTKGFRKRKTRSKNLCQH
jgi:hypothetical protein